MGNCLPKFGQKQNPSDANDMGAKVKCILMTPCHTHVWKLTTFAVGNMSRHRRFLQVTHILKMLREGFSCRLPSKQRIKRRVLLLLQRID